MSKQPIDISQLRQPADDPPTLAEACLDYLGIEHADAQTEIDAHLSKHFQQRLRTGQSLAVRITDVQESPETEKKLRITGEIDYSKFPYENPGDVLASLRYKDGSGTSTGEFVTGIPVDRQLNPIEDPDLISLYKFPSFTIQSLDINDDQCTGTVELDALTFGENGGEFITQTPTVKHAPGDEPENISEGDIYLLDPTIDDYTAESAYYVLKNPEYNGLCEVMESFIDGTVDNTSSKFDSEGVETFLKWMHSDASEPFGPNPEQEAFISDIDHEVSMLQGPPGTGKTSGAVAPAIVSRLLAYDGQGPCRALVTGASNKSIDEVMADVSSLLQRYRDHPDTDDALDDVMLLRATEPPEDPEDRDPTDDGEPGAEIVYTAFYDNENLHHNRDEIQQRIQKGNISPIDDKHIVVFATPRRAWRLGKEFIPSFALKGDTNRDGPAWDAPEPSEAELQRYRLFDVLVADEASMMNIPGFLLAGTFYDPGGNILLSGDHRQLPPVQQHRWDDEFRPAVTELAPYLSVLNFFRLLNGEDLTVIDDDLQELINVTSPSNIDIPLHQLEQTYRCHTRVADFLQKWVYWKLDDLDYTSEETYTINDPSPTTDGVATAVAPDAPLVVVTYDDESSQQSNPLEAELATQLILETDTEDDAGIVTPHNAQRGLLETTLEKQARELEGLIGSKKEPKHVKRTDIDTVERFQGGERDLVLVSGTVSDPDYVAAESDFLLNLNRLNVAMSRMKKKLVVIASESIFDHIPLDVEEYNQALLWKGLAKDAGLADDSRSPDWEGSVTEFTGKAMSELPDEADGTTVKVYCL